MSTKKARPTKADKQKVIQRIINVKKRLPESGVTSLFVHTYPEYKSKQKRALVQSVLSLRSTNATIVNLLEKLATKISI